MEFKRFPTGFVIPAQPVAASRPPSGQTGPRISSMTGIVDRTARLLAIASATERIEARSFTIDGEAVVLGF